MIQLWLTGSAEGKDEGQAKLLDRVEGGAPQQVLLQVRMKCLAQPVAFGLAHEGGELSMPRERIGLEVVRTYRLPWSWNNTYSNQ